MVPPRHFPLTWQVVVRLLQAWTITAAVTLLGATWLYYSSFDKAAAHHADDARAYFSARVQELERGWQGDAVRLKGRLEFMRMLEDREHRWARLSSFFTTQSGNSRFKHVLIADAKGQVLYRYGSDAERLPRVMAQEDPLGWYYDAERESLSRVYRQPIWLGADGMGYAYFFKPLDNALLLQNAYPSTDLFLGWQGKVIASSLGEDGRARVNPRRDGTVYVADNRYEQVSIAWDARYQHTPVLILQQRIDRLFTPLEIGLAALAILSVLTLFTWFTVGFWLTRTARRIVALGDASARFAEEPAISPELTGRLAAARADGGDEIAEVAQSLNAMMQAVVRRNEERRAYQDVLRASEGKLRSYFDLSLDGILVVDGAGRFLEANPAVCALLGYGKAELLGMAIKDLKVPDERSRAVSQAYFQRMVDTGQCEGEVAHLKKDDTPVVLDIRAAALGGGRFLALVRDVTERRSMEQTLQRQMEELAQVNEELDEFTYMASHDLQEPLRKLVTFSDLLRQDAGHLPPQAEADLNFISDAADRMRSLVRDLLALSRAGKGEVWRVTSKLDEAADRALDALAIPIREGAAVITRDPLPKVRGDSTLLTQLYQNLIGNALKYAGEAPPRIHLSAGVENGRWVMGVRDNGIGIKPEYAELVFQPFKRLHGRGQFAGTGIGLAICRKVVERHGGKIWVESEEGRGAHFRFTLQPAEGAMLD